MAIFLIAVSGASVRAARERLDEYPGVDVLRTWVTPQAVPDFLVARAPDETSLTDAVRDVVSPTAELLEITLEEAPNASDTEIAAALPGATPESLRVPDVVAWIGAPLVWCDRCRAFHKPANTRGEHA